MASLPKTATVTYEEWLRMPVTEGREEVVDGEIQIMPAPKSDHAYIVENLVADFMRQLDRKQYRVLSGNFGLIIRTAPFTSRTPDLAIFERATIVVVDGYFRSAPQLAIEVLSPSETRRMTERKLRDYESIGLEEVWLISPEAATVEILLLQDGKLRQSQILTQGILKPKHFPGVQIDISGIWPD
jgi:Uma2 family endonuclease